MMVMPGSVGARVLGIVDGVANQLSHVLVLQPIEDLGPLATGPDQPGHPQLGQMLGY